MGRPFPAFATAGGATPIIGAPGRPSAELADLVRLPHPAPSVED
jgi:hypothetical protein